MDRTQQPLMGAFLKADSYLLSLASKFPELSAAAFGWFVLNPLARLAARALGIL